MARGNRKVDSSPRSRWMRLSVGLLCVATVLAAGLALLRNRCQRLEADMAAAEKDRAAWERRWRNEEHNWAAMTTPESIERALAQHRIVMGPPRRDQIVRLREPSKPDAQWAANAERRPAPAGATAEL